MPGSARDDARQFLPGSRLRTWLRAAPGKALGLFTGAYQTESLADANTGLGRREYVPGSELGAMPYASICRIWSDTSEGSGFVAGPGLVLTAAHVLHNALSRTVTFADGLEFTVGSDSFAIHPSYQSEGDRFDIAAIRLDPHALAGRQPIAILTASDELTERSECEVAGYAAGFATMVRHRVSGARNAEGEFAVRTSGGQVHHRIDTSRGQSGAPILVRPGNGSGTFAAIGVHTYGKGNMKPGLLNHGTAFPVSGFASP